MSGLVSTIQNIKKLIIPWYYFFLKALAFPLVFYLKIADSFIELLIEYILSRQNLLKTLFIYASLNSLIFSFSRLRYIFRPSQKLMGPILTIKKAKTSFNMTWLIILLLFSTIILILSTNMLMTSPSRPVFVTKML